MKQSVANEGDRQTMFGGEHKIIQFMLDGQERVLWRTIDFSGILNCLSLRSGLNRGQRGRTNGHGFDSLVPYARPMSCEISRHHIFSSRFTRCALFRAY